MDKLVTMLITGLDKFHRRSPLGGRGSGRAAVEIEIADTPWLGASLVPLTLTFPLKGPRMNKLTK